MMHPTRRTLALSLLALAAGAIAMSTGALAAEPAAAPSDILFEDAAANSSATITQVLPNSSTSQMTLENVRRIRVKQDILVIEWGNTATTLLPRQYVSAITINHRNPARPPATLPATMPR